MLFVNYRRQLSFNYFLCRNSGILSDFGSTVLLTLSGRFSPATGLAGKGAFCAGAAGAAVPVPNGLAAVSVVKLPVGSTVCAGVEGVAVVLAACTAACGMSCTASHLRLCSGALSLISCVAVTVIF